ncbi:uncharacterized protein LOC117584589 [Drosophila guanche]|uniref:uncharacterized protein LOC117584589 n=1 Tax=Drosophila guanche TaxID=7266 RepID=UPI0014722E23|nr:uncharacterized protein LOC117584589 [Drosophila guanche]
MEYFTKDNIEMMVKHCQQLERLSFNVENLYLTVPYDLICLLPRLKHLELWHDGSISDSLIEGLINKKGSPLESLIIGSGGLFEDQVKHICNISTFFNLKNLLYLHIHMPVTNDQAMDLLKGLPRLEVLNLRNNEMIDHDNLVNSVRTWMSEQREQRGKIKIYLQNSPKYLLENNCDDIEPLIEIINGLSLRDPILMSKKLSERV